MSLHINYMVMKLHMRNLIMGAMLTLIAIILFAFHVLKLSYDMVLNITYFYVTMVYILTNYQFIFAAVSVKLRFELLSECLV